MSKNEIIAKLASVKMVEGIVHNVSKKDDDQLNDLVQDIYMSLMEKDEEKIVKLYEDNQMRFFITRMVINNIHSKNSPYWCNYKRFTTNMNELGDYTDGD